MLAQSKHLAEVDSAMTTAQSWSSSHRHTPSQSSSPDTETVMAFQTSAPRNLNIRAASKMQHKDQQQHEHQHHHHRQHHRHQQHQLQERAAAPDIAAAKGATPSTPPSARARNGSTPVDTSHSPTRAATTSPFHASPDGKRSLTNRGSVLLHHITEEERRHAIRSTSQAAASHHRRQASATTTGSYARRKQEAETLLGPAFGQPQPGGLDGAATPTPGGPVGIEELLAPLHRSFSSPNAIRGSQGNNFALVNSSSIVDIQSSLPPNTNSHPWDLHRHSGDSIAIPRFSVDRSDADSMHPLRFQGGASQSQGLEGGTSVESFSSRHPLTPSPLATAGAGRSRAGTNAFSIANSERLVLSRVTSEPTAGPMIQHFMKSRVPTFAREPPHDMAEAVSRAGRILEEKRKSSVQATKGRDDGFWLTFFAVFVTAFLSAVDLTIISPILPTIGEAMPKSGISATWITSAFLATSASFQPLFGGLSDAIGRRESLMLAIVIFLAGSVVACLANTMLTIVTGRGIQGLGGGGMLVVGEIIISDMTTLAERGYFLGLLSIAFAVAALAAPLAGGWFATFDWRVAFYINFPIGAIALAMLLPAKLQKPKLSLAEKIQRTDLVGSLILFGSILSLLIGLTNGGVQAPWTDASIAIPLACGTAGLAVFIVVEFVPNRLSRYPILPSSLFRHRTAAISYFLTFLHGCLLYGATQGLVLYFENRGDSPLMASVKILPANAPSTPAAFIAGILMAVTGRYKGQIILSEALMTLGLGLCIYLDLNSSTAQWCLFQMIASFGLGALYSLTLPPIQATLPADELAHATATFAFLRSFGAVWGVSAFLIAFQVQAGQDLSRLPGAAEAGITGATAIEFVPIIATVQEIIRDDVALIFQDAIRIGFIVLVPFAAIGFVASFFMKHVALPDFNDSKYGIEGQELKRGKSRRGPKPRKLTLTGLSEVEKSGSDGNVDPADPPTPEPSVKHAGGFSPTFRVPFAAADAASSWEGFDGYVTQLSPSTSWPSNRGLSTDADRVDDDVDKYRQRLESSRASLEQKRAAFARRSVDLERQFQLLQDEVDRSQRAQLQMQQVQDVPGGLRASPPAKQRSRGGSVVSQAQPPATPPRHQPKPQHPPHHQHHQRERTSSAVSSLMHPYATAPTSLQDVSSGPASSKGPSPALPQGAFLIPDTTRDARELQ